VILSPLFPLFGYYHKTIGFFGVNRKERKETKKCDRPILTLFAVPILTARGRVRGGEMENVQRAWCNVQVSTNNERRTNSNERRSTFNRVDRLGGSRNANGGDRLIFSNVLR